MNRTKLKNYAPQARRDFIQAMKDRAAFYGITNDQTELVVERGDVAVIAGREHPRSVAKKRKQLEDRIKQHGFEHTIESLAYTWFNRLVAIRFMEWNGYLEHGYRVLSHPEGKTMPQILEEAEHVELPGLKKESVIDLKLAGNRESELYRLLLIAQCNALHAAMPFLFEKVEDESELLLPENLLHSDSLIRKLVCEIDEDDWNEVEVIGWLYQFYISDKKDEVIGKVVASEDIPAATQLFTPNWIVKYLVQNTLGRQWLATYPQSALRQQMDYYIEPAEQTPEVQEQLKAVTSASLNPEELTLLDPACGSGHILAEAYDLFKSIYQERGYRAKDIPALILQKNLFGLEIDDRAAQLAAFALMMKARADDRRIFDSQAKPNILAFVDSQGMDSAEITHALNSPINKDDVPSEYLFEEIEEEKAGLFSKKALAEKGHVFQADISALLNLFENAKTFGSLIQVPPKLATTLPGIEQRLDDVLKHGSLATTPAHVLKPLLHQARMLAKRYDAVVANPPYMGGKYYSPTLKAFVNHSYKNAKADLYACFIQRNIVSCKPNGFIGMITIPNWMFLSSFEDVRKMLFDQQTIDTFIHNGRGVFGSDFGSCNFVYRNTGIPDYRGTFRRLFEKQGSVSSNEELVCRYHTAKTFVAAGTEFLLIPGSPIAYWASPATRMAFTSGKPIGTVLPPCQGLATTNNDLFLRKWHEVSVVSISFSCTSKESAVASGKKWFPFNKGGDFRKWYGNGETVINFENNGQTICDYIDSTPGVKVSSSGRVINRQHYFREGITWSDITSGASSFRRLPVGFVLGNVGHSAFPNGDSDLLSLLSYLNTPVVGSLTRILCPTVHFDIGYFKKIPFLPLSNTDLKVAASELCHIAKMDWDAWEISWDFERLAVLQHRAMTIQLSQETADAECLSRFARMKQLEERNNRLFIEAYGLKGELSPEVSDDQITLYRPNPEEDIKRLLSYSVGCMMGRYSLDEPGLIYANSGNQDFDSSHYKTFRADDDGIIPLMETDWGIRDDATNRIVEFIGVVWPKDNLEENLKFIAASLGPNSGEQPRETIRRYLATGFYKHHLPMYKKRPIYWLFSSGRERAFQCLVYLHRYNEGTLARMRTEYVIPLQGQIAARIEQLEGDKTNATSTSNRKKLQKEQDDLKKQQVELLSFDEKLKNAADMQIKLDLDDGVKVNYGKFGDLLAEVKAITGGKEEE